MKGGFVSLVGTSVSTAGPLKPVDNNFHKNFLLSIRNRINLKVPTCAFYIP